jgi:hypothetical protein
MSASTTKRSGVAKLSSAFANIYSIQPNYWGRVTMLHLVNTTGAAATVKVCIAAPGVAGSQDNALMWGFNVPANDMIEFGDGYWLSSQTSLIACCSVDGAVNLHWSIEEE